MHLSSAISSTAQHLLRLRTGAGHWRGYLSSSALSTATAVVALSKIDAVAHADYIRSGRDWLAEHQNVDGGWGDTVQSKSNLSTTLLCWSALHLGAGDTAAAQSRAGVWLTQQVGSTEPAALAAAVVQRYGKDKTFSVPILMHCVICGTLGDAAWKRVLPLPFELAALPRSWFGAIGLPVVSYALPALIAIGYARFHHAPPSRFSPLRWLRSWASARVLPMLAALQPQSGGYLEATPLTSFVTMALAAAGLRDHACVAPAVDFLCRSMRADGAWPIDTDLATWATTLSIKALTAPGYVGLDEAQRASLADWLLTQQYQSIHPFTNAAPGGWAWTDLSGGVPDADDTAGALLALKALGTPADSAAQAGLHWLAGLQNRDGGMPTFCRGWGTLPFDRSTAELTTHALRAAHAWGQRGALNKEAALRYLQKTQHAEGWWEPLWFGNEHAPGEVNAVYGTAQVLIGLLDIAEHELVPLALEWLLAAQHTDGSWGGSSAATASIEETAVCVEALSRARSSGLLQDVAALQRGVAALLARTKNGTQFPSAPIGLYFARLWYDEQTYPVAWTLSALAWARTVLP